MSYNKEDILEQDDETDNYIKALDDSDVDDIEEELKTACNVESEEYSDDDTIYQSNRILQPLVNMNLNYTDEKKLIQCRTEESDEYSDDENIYPSKVITTDSNCTRKLYEEKWTFVAEGIDCRSKYLPDFKEPSGPAFALPACPMPSDCYNKMLPDSLFNHIAECTNLRAKMHFANIPTKIPGIDENISAFNSGVPKELMAKKMKAPDSSFMRSGELLLVKFLDKKATGEKEIFVIDSKGVAGRSPVERYEKGGVKKQILKPNSIIDYNRHMGGVDLSDSALHHTFIDRKTYRWFVKLALHFVSRLLFNSYIIYKDLKPNTTLDDFLMRYVRETMETTGVGRKSERDFTPKQKRSISTNSTDRKSKVMIPTIIQHFSSKTDIDPESNRHKQKRCVFCNKNKIRKMTIYQCRTCNGKPGLCFPECFEKFHLIPGT